MKIAITMLVVFGATVSGLLILSNVEINHFIIGVINLLTILSLLYLAYNHDKKLSVKLNELDIIRKENKKAHKESNIILDYLKKKAVSEKYNINKKDLDKETGLKL